jgi:Protein of unknown function (DUF3667)
VSHIPQRKEKDCLNCGTVVQGKYCQHCGQENVVPKETFWHMVTHFFYDITHFDSNFFSTIHHLILKPGFLSRQYMAGKRASYLHPIKMYVFTSAIFFLLFFSLFKPENAINLGADIPLDIKERSDYITKWQDRLKTDTGNMALTEKLAKFKDTSKVVTAKDVLEVEAKSGLIVNLADKEYKSIAEYDSTQKTLPPSERAGWLARRFAKFGINITRQFREDPDGAATKLAEGFFHRLPYLLFVSLPLFALILKLVYVRRKQFYFADHGVFTIHLYVFSFIVLLVVFGLDKLQSLTGWDFLDTLQGFVFFGLVVYLYVAMRNFYKQGWGKTFIKFLLVSLLSLIMMMILFTGFLLFSAATL